MKGLFRKMSALLLSLGLAVEPGLSAFPGQTGLQSYAAENTIEQENDGAQSERASASDLKRSRKKKQDKSYFGAAALRKASSSNLSIGYLGGEESISLAAETGDEENETAAKGRALIIAQTEDESLKDGPKEDAEALMQTLLGTEQFDADSITILEVPQSAEDDSYRESIWQWIDDAAKDGSALNLIAYSGHGDYHNDGNSELSLGTNNSISAQELKQHVSKLSGKLILAIDCCYSGGMIMPTSLEDELADSEMTVTSSEELQKQADQEMKDFVSDFRKATKAVTSDAGVDEDNVGASGIAAASGSTELQYYIYAAASAYETSIQGSYGGQLLVALGHALGYDRKNEGYAVFAADTDAAYGEITATELADYVKNSCTVATPTVYPSSSDAVLFSYEKGYMAGLTVRAAEKQNVKKNGDGSITVKVKVTNHSDSNVTVDAMAASDAFTELDTPGDYDAVMANIEARYASAIMQTDNTAEIKAGQTKTISFKFTDHLDDAGVDDGGRFLVRVWDMENTMNYGITDFYVAGSEETEGPDEKALAFRKPAAVYSAEDAIEVSAMVPINVQFDTEPTEKKGYADCTLTAQYYDLGESSGANAEKKLKGYQVDKSGEVSADNNEIVSEDGWQTIYADIRPAYTRTDIYAGTLNGSTYSYVWDVTELTDGHYYALQLICQYGNGSTKKLATFIRKVDKTDADQAQNVIGEVNIASRYFAENYQGIRLGENWNSRTVATVSAQYEEYLNTQSFVCRTTGEGDKQQNFNYIYASVEGPSGGSGWYELDADGEFDGKTQMAEDAVFEPGKSYVSRLHLTIDKEANARFADNVVFTVAGHALYDDGTNASAVLATEDAKEAVIYVRHDNIGIEENKLTVYRAGTKEVLADGTTLKAGDQIDISCADGYDYTTDSCLHELKGDFGKLKRYEVLGTDGSAAIMLYHKLSGKVETTDSCGTCLFLYPIEADTSMYEQGDTFTLSGDFAVEGKDAVLSEAEKKKVVLLLSANYEDMENAQVTLTATHSLRLRQDGKASKDWPLVVPQKGAKLSYLIAYPADQQRYKYYDYEWVTKDGNIKVDFEARKDGLQITADSNGSYTLYGKFQGGNSGNVVVVPDEDEDETDTQHASGSSHSSGGSTAVSRAVSGAWQLSTRSLAAGNVQSYRFRLANGKDATGWQLIRWNNAEHWFYFGQDGYMCTGWIRDADKWYYLEKDGSMAIGWHFENGSWYYLEGSGSMATGWVRVGLCWYYFGSDGKMLTGRQRINGTEHSFREDGSWISNKTK